MSEQAVGGRTSSAAREAGADLAKALRARLGAVPVYGHDDPRADFSHWNVATARRPLARVECGTADDVAVALRVAAEHDVPVAVCAGRQDVAGRNSRADALVLDLRGMTGVRFDSATGEVEIGGAVTSRGVLDGLPSDVVVPTTANANVGMIGALTGGGYGLLAGSCGLTCDALLGAEMILADGERVTVDSRRNTDLLWALKGGGSGFGVVVSARLRTFSCPQVVSAHVSYGLDRAPNVLRAVQALQDDHPDRLGVIPVFIRTAADPSALVLFVVWNGPEAEGRSVLRALTDLPGATVANDGVGPFRATLEAGEIWPWDKHWMGETRTVRRLTDGDLAERLVAGAAAAPEGPFVYFLHDSHGRATRFGPDDAAFALREPHYVAAALTWSEPGDADRIALAQSWGEKAMRELDAFALPGGYVNFLKPSEPDRVAAFYGPATADRLRTIKRRVDPRDRFRYANGRLDG